MWDRFIAACSTWLWKQMKDAGAEGYVVGISGGIDSAVAAKLAVMGVGKERVLCVLLPIGREDELAQKVASWLGTEYEVIPLDRPYEVMLDELGCRADKKIALGNLKARLRMASLYFIANELNYLVLGTGNRTELEIGYFTKYGDGGVDVEPLGSTYKSNITGNWGLAKALKVPEEIIARPPSAGLWEGQTDEEEIGFIYQDVDWVLEDRWPDHDPPSPGAMIRVRQMQLGSEHKRQMPPMFDFDWEDKNLR